MLPVFVNVIWDPTLGFNTHTLWDPALTATPPPGVPKPNAPVPAIEMIATQMWTAGYFLGKNKFTTKVMHLGVPICIDDHDLGPLIPDITIPFPNIFYAIMWPFSGREMAVTASTVKMEGKPTSASQMVPVPIPMMSCGDPLTLPMSFPIVNWTHQLTVGVTPADLLMGLLKAVVAAAIDAFFEWGVPGIGKWIGSKLGKEAGEKAAKTVGPALLAEALGKVGLTPKAMAKRVVSGAAGFLTSLAGDDNPSFKLGVGGGVLPTAGFEIGGDSTTTIGGVPVSGTVGNTPTNDPLDVI